MTRALESSIHVRMLGRMKIRRGNDVLQLPASRKLIGLLAYLALARRPVARIQLCELLWDVPNDPRGELRWCLSKIRRLVDDADRPRVNRHGDAIEIDLADCAVDAIDVLRASAEGIETLDAERAAQLARQFEGDFLEGLDIDRSPLFNHWLTAERRRFRGFHAALLERLVDSLPDDAAFEHLDRWLQIAPFDRHVHQRMLTSLVRRGRLREAEEHFNAATEAFRDEGLEVAPIRDAWRIALSHRAAIGRVPDVDANPVEGRDDSNGANAPDAVRRSSICVLPFVNMSGDLEQEYFSDGITDDIITDLSKVSALFVIARNTAFTFKGQNVDVTQAARQLRVSHVLEGSVRRAGGRVRITAQLIDGETGGHVWAERYDRELNDIFEIQDEISGAIVEALKLRLLPQEKKSLERRGTTNLNAYDLFLRGTVPAFGADEQRARIALLEAATQLAPDYADAWGALANARAKWRLERPYAERDELARAVAADAERALALDRQNIDALAAQIQLLPPFGRFVEAEVLTDRMEAIARESGDARAWHACHLWRARHFVTVGRMQETIDASRRAYEIDPLDPFVTNLWGRNLAYGGRYTEGREILVDLLSRWPDNHYAAMSLISVSVATRDWATVDTLLAPERLAQFPMREFEDWARWYASVVRDTSEVSRRRPIEAARRRFDKTGLADFIQLQLAAEVGFANEAHQIALRARFGPPGTNRDRMGFDAYKTLTLFDEAFSEFRRHPSFVKVCARCGLVDYWIVTQRWPDCVDEVAPYYDFKAECTAIASGPLLRTASEAA